MNLSADTCLRRFACRTHTDLRDHAVKGRHRNRPRPGAVRLSPRGNPGRRICLYLSLELTQVTMFDVTTS